MRITEKNLRSRSISAISFSLISARAVLSPGPPSDERKSCLIESTRVFFRRRRLWRVPSHLSHHFFPLLSRYLQISQVAIVLARTSERKSTAESVIPYIDKSKRLYNFPSGFECESVEKGDAFFQEWRQAANRLIGQSSPASRCRATEDALEGGTGVPSSSGHQRERRGIE